MIVVSVQSVKPGRILASDVKNPHGQLLIRSGVTISERHIRVLKSWGVADVQVEGEPEEAMEGAADICDPESIERARSEIAARLRHNNLEHPMIQELVRHCVYRRARQISRGSVNR